MDFSDIATVNFQGTVVALARATGQLQSRPVADDILTGADGETSLATDIYYDILSLDVGSTSDALDWDGFVKLSLPDAVRPAGMNIVNVPVEYDASTGIDGLTDAGAPFRVASNQEYIYLFRQAKKGTLLVNRLRLVRDTSTAGQAGPPFRLAPAWEVRFQRSGKPDTPYDDKDPQSYVSTDREPFIEPALELFMIDGLTGGNFDVAFLPRGGSDLLTCAVFVANTGTNHVDVYLLPLDADGLFVLGDKEFVDGRIPPDFSFQVAGEDESKPYVLADRPSAAFYLKQERMLREGRDSFFVKRNGRLLLAVAGALPGGPRTLVTVDLAVADDGTLARPAPVLKAAPVGVANYALRFDAAGYVGLPDWAPKNGLSLDLWAYPEAFDVPRQQILGNRSDPAAFHLALVSGSALEVGFTSSDGATLVARTADGVVRQQAWSRVQVSFDAAAAERVTIRVNESPVPVTVTGEGTSPGDTPINALSAPVAGFEGIIDALVTYGAPGWQEANELGRWPFDTVDYQDSQGNPVDPPTTPNVKDPAAPGRVYGAHLVPSTSPSGNPAPALSWDSRGLSIYAAAFADLGDYGELASSPFLLAGSDGLIHCYFRGRGDRFCVMQLDTQIARATFESTWQTTVGPAESGRIQFVATQPGSFMNTATVTVTQTEHAPATFCDVTFASPSGRTERWYGVPRSLGLFDAVLQGAALPDPADSRLLTGARTYFDPTGSRPAAYLPIPANAAAAALALVSRQPGRMPLSSLEIVPAGATGTVTIRFTVPRWADQECTHTWPEVPMGVNALVRTLAGTSTSYPYRPGVYSNVKSYSLAAHSQLVAASRVVIFTRPAVEQATTITVSDSADTTRCTVQITLVAPEEGGEAEKTATWREVPRLQGDFALTLEGVNDQYDYEANASGEWAAIGQLVTVTTDGSDASVDNAAKGAGGPIEPDNDLRVSSSLIAAFTTDSVGDHEVVPRTDAPVTAARFQRATATEGEASHTITGGSLVFRPLPATVPAQGSVGLVGDTAALPGGNAGLSLQGYDGGWLNQPEDRALEFAWDNWVAIPTTEDRAPDISALTIQGDLSVELWCRPTRSRQDPMSPDQRLLTFSRTPTPSEGGDPVRYLVGLRDAPSLACTADTVIRHGFASVNGTFHAWFAPKAGAVSAGVVGSLCTLGVTRPALTVAVGDDQSLYAEFSLDPAQPRITATMKAEAGVWHQVAVSYATTVKSAGGKKEYSFAVSFYVDGALQGSQTYTITRSASDPIDMAALVVGDISTEARKTLPMHVNEVAYFERAIALDDVERFSQQRISDNEPGLVLKWMLIDGQGNKARNTAPTGTTYDADISPTAVWDDYGLYLRPEFGHGENVAVAASEPIIHGWSHLAFVHQAGYALLLRGADYADCGNDRSLDLGDTFTIEAWVQPDGSKLRAPQCVVAKGDDYELSLDPDGKPVFRVDVTIGKDTQIRQITGPKPLPADAAAYLAAVYSTRTIAPAGADPKDPQQPRYEVHLDLYVNGQRVAWGIQDPGKPDTYQQFDTPPARVSSSAHLDLGRTTSRGGSSYLRGYLADVRLWNRALEAGELQQVYASRHAPARRDGLVSYWRFAEVEGKTAYDSAGSNNARLNRGDLRLIYQPTSNNWYYVNGQETAGPDYLDGPRNVGGYGTGDQFLMAQVASGYPSGFYGQLDDVRIFAMMRTAEQIRDTMNQPLTGNEPGLRGYWNFDNGSGTVVSDRTGRGNNGTLGAATDTALPAWRTSTAPIDNEGPAVFNILGGISTFEQIEISGTPAAVEYADLERDAYGTLFSVMKRAYLAIRDGDADLITGFKVGDLDTVYLGQAQSSPSLIGFIEGNPPIPSENQTMPYWLDGYKFLNTYAGTASVQLSEADHVTYTYSADRDRTIGDSFSIKGGLFVGGQYSASEGIGLEVEEPTVVFEGHLGDKGGSELATHTTGGVSGQQGSSTTMATGLTSAGSWEAGTDPKGWVNPTVGRRYVPDNNGLALVKSLTVDLYASILRSTGSMVKITLLPDPDIPADVNLIGFPIDPKYVKNGTLDGKVGLRNDPDYPDADQRRGSYFRPIEAYAIKRQIERDAAQLEAYYTQFDVAGTAGRLGDANAFNDFRTGSRSTSTYDWAKHLAKRSIVNTYVWNAGGGTYAEEVEPMNVYTESYGSISSAQFFAGIVGDVQMSFVVAGFYVDFDYLHSATTEVNVVKSKEEGASFDLESSASPEAFLFAPNIDGDGKVTFGESPTEGKVDDYRYMSFFLPPSQDNADTFRQIIDLNWLENSRDPAAAALREATVAANGAWRVLHRVTFVSRIPPTFQPVPAQTQTPQVRRPANLTYNASIVELVKSQVAVTSQVTPLDIGAAVTKVLGTASTPGLLNTSLPWWGEFLEQTTDYALPAGKILRALREDLLQYMLSWYATLGPEGHA